MEKSAGNDTSVLEKTGSEPVCYEEGGTPAAVATMCLKKGFPLFGTLHWEDKITNESKNDVMFSDVKTSVYLPFLWKWLG